MPISDTIFALDDCFFARNAMERFWCGGCQCSAAQCVKSKNQVYLRVRRERYKRYTSFFGARFLLLGAKKTKANQDLAKGREIWRVQIWDACRKDLEASQSEEKERR
jgi:hypothetical protein